MDPALLDLLFVAAASIAAVVLGVVGTLALPWTDREIDDTLSAVTEVRRLAGVVWRRVFHRAPAQTPTDPGALRSLSLADV